MSENIIYNSNKYERVHLKSIKFGKKIKATLETLGILYMFMMSITVLYIWFTAYFTNSKKTTSYINSIGEANLELVLHIIGVICMIFYIIKFHRDMKEEKV